MRHSPTESEAALWRLLKGRQLTVTSIGKFRFRLRKLLRVGGKARGRGGWRLSRPAGCP
jgi:hypothetical protein